MAHKEQQEFIQRVKAAFPERFRGQRVLEVGSLDINGSVRSFFADCDYIGLDIGAGKGVDVVCEGQKYDAPDASFDVVISCEAMEHNPYWKETMDNMIRLTRPGGLVIMSCATLGRREHGTSRTSPENSPLTTEQGWNYYRNLHRGDLERAVDLAPLAAWDFASNWDSYDLYFAGLKAPAQTGAAGLVAGVFEPYRKRFWSSLRWLRRGFRQHAKCRLLGTR